MSLIDWARHGTKNIKKVCLTDDRLHIPFSKNALLGIFAIASYVVIHFCNLQSTVLDETHCLKKV